MTKVMTDAERLASIDRTLAMRALHFARSKADAPKLLASIRELWSERAAIREYLGGLRHRRNAELHAVADAIEMFNQRAARAAIGGR